MDPAASGWYVIGVVMLFGALGGFVDGLTTDISYKVSWGSRSFDIGSAGDALVGMTAAIAIFTVASALFPDLKVEQFGNDMTQLIRVVALGVLSGYAGIRLLNPLTRKIAEQIATDKADAAVRAARTQSVELTINVKDGDRKLIEFDLRKEQLLAAGGFDEAQRILEQAQQRFKAALEVDADDAEALMGSAKVARRKAELAGQQGRDAAADWTAALRALDAVTSRDPRAARAWYNKACYKALMGKPPAEVVRDAGKAFELLPALKERARTDPDFAGLKTQAEFAAAVA
ncbi:TPR end-of-group domain-containing protein [Aquabacterium humicola]|uniref:TPR end-of-group domain-containing protein n=1 Tax=Aquabacterium humicola TaxID=3237377 RepID=UPI0025427673|nr:hypothetical protein [Rubrivivax pictus]